MAKKKEQYIIEDWLDRDDDYVYRGGTRSGWDSEYKSTSNYVLSGFVKPDNTEAELHEIYKLCKNRSQILSTDKEINLVFNNKENTARTDGKKLLIGTGVLNESGKTFEEKADIMLGLTTHEMAHTLHSTFSHLKKVEDKFHKSILNVIEDERIEYLLCKEFPGYAKNIADTKQYFFDEKYIVEDMSKEESATELEVYARELFDIFFKLVRYPKYLDPEMMDKYEIELDEIKAILNPYPITAIDAFNASKTIREIFRKAVSKKAEDLSKSSSGKLEKSEERREETEESSEESSTESSETEETSVSESPIEGVGSGEGTSASASEIEEIVKKAESEIAEMMKDFMSDSDGEKKVEIAKDVKDIDFDKEIIYDGGNKAMFRTGISRKDNYEIYLSEVRGDASRLASSLFTRMFNEATTLRGLRSGSLDESRLIEAVHGVKNVHIRTTPKEVKAVNIVVLIDESGSMSSEERYVDAAKAGILIEKAFETFPAGQLFIYGFTADVSWGRGGSVDFNQIIRYREPGLNVKYGLGDVRPRANNRDGHAIRAVANRVRQFTNDPMIFFVISDGSPAAQKYGGFEDTRAAVLEVTKKRFFPIQIGISSGISPKEQAQMFDDFIHYKDSKTMVDDLRKLIIRKSQKIFGL